MLTAGKARRCRPFCLKTSYKRVNAPSPKKEENMQATLGTIELQNETSTREEGLKTFMRLASCTLKPSTPNFCPQYKGPAATQAPREGLKAAVSGHCEVARISFYCGQFEGFPAGVHALKRQPSTRFF